MKIPEQVRTVKEWIDWEPRKALASLTFVDETGWGKASKWQNKVWAGNWFRVPELDKKDPKSGRVLKSTIGMAFLTPEIEWINSDYETVEINLDSKIRPIKDPPVEYQEIAADFEISSINIPHKVTYSSWGISDGMGTKKIQLYKRNTFRVYGLYGFSSVLVSFGRPGNAGRKEAIRLNFSDFNNRTVAIGLYDSDGKLIQSEDFVNENNDNIVSLDQVRQQKDYTKYAVERQRRLKYMWLLTYNDGDDPRTEEIFGYVPRGYMYKFGDPDKDYATNEEIGPLLYKMMKSIAGKLKLKKGRLSVWELHASTPGMPEDIYKIGEKISTKDIDVYRNGEYEYFGEYPINSHLRLVKY